MLSTRTKMMMTRKEGAHARPGRRRFHLCAGVDHNLPLCNMYITNPVSGYEFCSLKDARRYIESGDTSKCNVRPKKRTAQDACITQNQDYVSSSYCFHFL
ncbi:unnamed protein product [Triticum turgidum subsp. durum]|uniref:Uncharacterized protein n=1 Tax=Triticum turgidum subsp. durum TaxID=4567 RepID=A0A9R1BRL3_TRITD|nr:unnamed protein product [Triticum turgidum subsp. durum]